MNEPDPMDETGIDQRDPRRCTAHNRAGAPCGKFAMRGQAVAGITAGPAHRHWPKLRRPLNERT